ncbi:MAG: hypothetical protein ACO3DQ_05690 [Cephaloticoccus sp.]
MKFKSSRVRPAQLVAVGVFLVILFVAQWVQGRTLLTGKDRENRGTAYRVTASDDPLAFWIVQGIISASSIAAFTAAWVKRYD